MQIAVLMIIVTTVMIMSIPHRDFPHVFSIFIEGGEK